jgi:hypothetical protein
MTSTCSSYDGFTIITIGWLENLGWCKPGEAERFLAANWDDDTSRIVIDDRVP